MLQALRAFSERADRLVDDAAQELGLHRTDLRALSVLMAHEHAGQAATAGDLRHELNLTPAATTAVLDRLTASGHAVRRRGDHDRRQVFAAPTAAAASDAARAFAPLSARIANVLDGVDDADLAAALRVIRALADALEEPTSQIGTAARTAPAFHPEAGASPPEPSCSR